ncbi:hypothetical protein ES703_19881 [subsurface metagenome]
MIVRSDRRAVNAVWLRRTLQLLHSHFPGTLSSKKLTFCTFFESVGIAGSGGVLKKSSKVKGPGQQTKKGAATNEKGTGNNEKERRRKLYVRNVLKHGGSISVVIPRSVCKEWKLSHPGLVAMKMNKEGKLLLWKLDPEFEAIAVRKGRKEV